MNKLKKWLTGLYILTFVITIFFNLLGVLLFFCALPVFFRNLYDGGFVYHTPLIYVEYFSMDVSLLIFLFLISGGFLLIMYRFLDKRTYFAVIVIALIAYLPAIICIFFMQEYDRFSLDDICVLGVFIYFRDIILKIMVVMALVSPFVLIANRWRKKRKTSRKSNSELNRFK